MLGEVAITSSANAKHGFFRRNRDDRDDRLEDVEAKLADQNVTLLARRIRQSTDFSQVLADTALDVSDVVHVMTPVPGFRGNAPTIPEALSPSGQDAVTRAQPAPPRCQESDASVPCARASPS